MAEGDGNRLDRNKLSRGGLKFARIIPARMKGWIEQFVTLGSQVKILGEDDKPLKKDGKTQWEFKEKTMSEEVARSLIENPFFQKPLPEILRILPVPVPILTSQGDIRLPHAGFNFNRDLGIYLLRRECACRREDGHRPSPESHRARSAGLRI
jgi:hypothetical protein